jgi:carbon starvation protein
MNVLVYFFAAVFCFVAAYRFYGRFLSKSLDQRLNRLTPAAEINDGRDFVPTRPSILFAHHFATIAGAGPIIGPTLGILYGIGPAWLWVVLGAIFIGGVHDFVTLFASIRERGLSIAEIARKSLGDLGFTLFIAFSIILIILVTSAFLSLTAVSLTSQYPLEKFGLDSSQTLLRTTQPNGETHGIVGGIASTSVVVITILAPLIGFLVTKKNIKTWLAYFVASLTAFLGIIIGFQYPISLSPELWMLIIATYTFFACYAPCWLILQPRDFVNVQILYSGMIFMLLGIVVSGFSGATVAFPFLNIAEGTSKMGPLWPFLFITIACGAVSGFHSLVASGTTAKQLARESQAKVVSYGSMLLEGLLAVLVLLALATSLSFEEYISLTWPDTGLGNPVLAFALSIGHLLQKSLGIQLAIGTVFGLLIIEGFLITTLDSAVRLNRYLFEELWNSLFKSKPIIVGSVWFNSLLSVILMLALALSNGYKLIWPLFGATNQLLAALTLIAASVWLYRSGRKNWFVRIPAFLMMATTIVALAYYLVVNYIPAGNWILAFTDALLLALAIGVFTLSIRALVTPKPLPEATISS